MKSTITHIATLALIALSTTAYPQSKPNPEEAEIRATRQASNEALKHRDIQSFAASLDTEFVMVRGNGVLVPSRQACIDTFTQDFANPKAVTYERIPDKIDLSTAAPLAAEYGHWIGRADPGNTPAYSGTYLAMWRKTPTGWKLRSELFILLTCHETAACANYRKP